jgi:hypothetical protein
VFSVDAMIDRLDRAGFALSMALLFVWSLPGTVALRGVLLVTTLAVLARRLVHPRPIWFMRTLGLPLGLFAALTIWLLTQAFLISPETHWALDELRGQWLPALLALVLGMALAMASNVAVASTGPGIVATAIVLIFGAQAIIAVGQSVWHWIAHGVLLRQLVPLTGGKLEMSFIINLLLAFLVVDLFHRVAWKSRLVRLPLGWVLAIAAAALLSAYLAEARNGIIGIVFLSFSAVSLFILAQYRQLGFFRTIGGVLAIIVTVGAFATASYRADKRWLTFAETAAIAWDIDKYKTWRDGNLWNRPVLPGGGLVEPSAYFRIAYIHTGLRLIELAPLGQGYGRNAFSHALRQQFPEVKSGHAHSGWIDLGVGGGIPAMLLWAAFVGSLMWRGLREFFGSNNPHGLLLFLLSTGYAGRMVLDSVNKDHMLQIFLFLAGLLLILTLPPSPKKS